MNIRRWVNGVPYAIFATIAFAGVAGIFEVVRGWVSERRMQLLAEAVRGPEEEKAVERAAAWLGSKGLDSNLYLQCRADGECALTYTRNGVLHGGVIRCYDKGCIALSGW